MRRYRQVFILTALVAFMLVPQSADTCGPFFDEYVFVRPHGPDEPIAEFAKGKLGVVLPSWYEAFRVVAYRYLEGQPLSPAEQQSLVNYYDTEHHIQPPDSTNQAIEGWLSVRAEYRKLAPLEKPTEFRPNPDGFSSCPNCLAPAFTTATETLKNRAQEFGAASPELQEWITGQDMVFENCSGGTVVPPELPPTANPLLRADRAYQIAAANFYGGTKEDLEVALKAFPAIASDKASPWHNLGPYLVARTLVRIASVTSQENQTYNPKYLAKAGDQLNALLSDPQQQSRHDDARAMLDLVDYHLHPAARKTKLGQLLAGGGTGIHFGQYLLDYSWLNRPEAGVDPLTEWLSAGGSLQGAVDKWHATHLEAWLVAVLWQLQPRDGAYAEVMEAAAKVPPTSAAFPTVAYYRARLALRAGNVGLARSVLASAMQNRKPFPPSTVNLMKDEQTQVAANFDGFVAHLSQLPIGMDNDWGQGIHDCGKLGCPPQFSPVAATVLNTRIPADLFVRVAQSQSLPRELRRRMALAAWSRAALLDRPELAQQVADSAIVSQSLLKPYVEEYAQAKTADERRFAAAFAILHFPGLRPYVDASYPRATAFEKIDDYRDNWWCADSGNHLQDVSYHVGFSQNQDAAKERRVPFPAFLSGEERKQVGSESKRLKAMETSSRYLPRVVLDWAKAHPDDPRVPEALHLAVRSIRYSCSEGTTNLLGHQAFDILHQRYASSVWAKKTPYWFE